MPAGNFNKRLDIEGSGAFLQCNMMSTDIGKLWPMGEVYRIKSMCELEIILFSNEKSTSLVPARQDPTQPPPSCKTNSRSSHLVFHVGAHVNPCTLPREVTSGRERSRERSDTARLERVGTPCNVKDELPKPKWRRPV